MVEGRQEVHRRLNPAHLNETIKTDPPVVCSGPLILRSLS